MQQVKIFKSIEGELQALEDEINQWIRRSGGKILSITGNIAPQTQPVGPRPEGLGLGGDTSFPPSDVLLVVLYEAPDASRQG